jgi:hypothetical protein
VAVHGGIDSSGGGKIFDGLITEVRGDSLPSAAVVAFQ